MDPSAIEPRSPVTIGILSAILIVIALAIIVGNIVVILAVTSYRQLKQQRSNQYILNLAVTDLGVVLLVVIWSLIAFASDMGREGESWQLTQGMCYIQCAMNYCLIVVSMMTLGFVSVDRFIHIVYPLHYINIVTATRVRITIIWTWIQGLIIGFIPVGMGWIHYDYCELVCAIDWSSEHADKYVIVAFVTCFIAPAFTMIFCYSVILKEIQNSMKFAEKSATIRSGINQREKIPFAGTGEGEKKNKRVTELQRAVVNSVAATSGLPRGKSAELPKKQTTLRRHNSSSIQHKAIIKSLLIVVVVFFICMTPFSVTKLIKVLDGHIPCSVNIFATFVHFSASAFNPLIYGIFRKEYRVAFMRIFKRCCNRLRGRDGFDFNSSLSFSKYFPRGSTLSRQNTELSAKQPSPLVTKTVMQPGEPAAVPEQER